MTITPTVCRVHSDLVETWTAAGLEVSVWPRGVLHIRATQTPDRSYVAASRAVARRMAARITGATS
jgi:hypothetical protein